ncbi:hypothetical protein [Chlamydiifrater volucris]|uniref:hypothetical protein n=1 Tax=Chlamydiifrater volucris TaxID=2681470 RepID=UPI001BD169CB|nr:hypothetical protein [Chlamydiifrater volucris]
MFFQRNNLLSSILTGLLVLGPLNTSASEADKASAFLDNFKELFSSKKNTKEGPVDLVGFFSGDWKKYDYKDSGFSVELPKEPEYSRQTIEIPQSDITIRYETFVTEPNENLIYVISVWNYPEKIDIGKPEQNLQEGFAGMLSALPESHVLFMQSATHQGHQSLEFWIRNEDIFFRGKLICVDHTLYQVFMVYKSNDAKSLDQEYQQFSSSFHITKPRASKVQSINKKKISL